jgi:hypothetical protein
MHFFTNKYRDDFAKDSTGLETNIIQLKDNLKSLDFD